MTTNSFGTVQYVGAAPAFAVVGRVNKGKSSIIATFTENANIKIAPKPRTTIEVDPHEVVYRNQELFRVLDTPGFEEAPALLAELRKIESDASRRVSDIRTVLDQHRGSQAFVVERKLLTPILQGAAIVYVVDGTVPYRQNYEAEMEILRRTGQPGIALINKIGDDESHVESWRLALKQYFDIVRDFDAHHATFAHRMQLLRDMGTIQAKWRDELDLAVRALERERTDKLEEAAEVISTALLKIETHTLAASVGENETHAARRERLEERFHNDLREIEARMFRNIDQIFQHPALDIETDQLNTNIDINEDLFSEDTWSAAGLEPSTEIGMYALGGAATGLVADAAVGGLSGGAGAFFGGLSGAGVGLYRVGKRFAQAGSPGGALREFGRMFSGDNSTRITIGPHPSTNLPFVVLNRATTRLDLVRNWAHARREFAGMADATLGDIRDRLSLGEQKSLAKLLASLRKQAPNPSADLEQRFRARVSELISKLAGGSDTPAF